MSLSLVLAAVLALQDPQDPPSTVLEDVVVEGVRRDERTSFDFVRNISAPPFGSRMMAARTDPLCLVIENVRAEVADVIDERIRQRAEFVGLEPPKPDCKPNAIVVFTADGAETASSIIQGNRMVFQPTSGPTQMTGASLEKFTEGDRPVRWWTVNMPVDVDTGRRVVALAGEHIIHYANVGGKVVTLSGGPPWREVRGILPRGDNVRESLLHTVVVVDARFTSTVAPVSLGDYLAMVLLTQIDPDVAMPNVPTIINLFSAQPTVTEWSQWDADYLKALYDTPVRWSHIRFQQQDMARRMVAAAETRSGQ